MTQRTQNILLAPVGWLLKLYALMPWWLLYAHATAVYYLAYHVLRYRRKVVKQNLVECFPDKSSAELKRLRRSFTATLPTIFSRPSRYPASATTKSSVA